MDRRLKYLCTICALLTFFALFGRQAITNGITFQLLIRQASPSVLAVYDVLDSTEDPTGRIQALWSTSRIPHRHLAIRYLKERVKQKPFLASKLRPLIWEATRDPDFSNRELALGIISETESEKIKSLLQDLLKDRDQGTRLRALHFITDVEDTDWLPVFIELLDDPDPMIVAQSAAKLRRWTGQDFGIRMLHAIPGKDGTNNKQPLETTPAQQDELRQGVTEWKRWWSGQPDQMTDIAKNFKERQTLEPLALPVENFEIQNLKGQTLKLSDFKGKAVLLNFWATWCASCMTEMPDLNWLQTQYPNDLQVIGICLDGEDGHGHEHSSIVDIEEAREKGWDAVHKEYGETTESHGHGHNHDHASTSISPDLAKIEKKVRRVVLKKELLYPVAMDPFSEIGKRYNGQELPTNVLIDGKGKLRRRFVGTRPIQSWQDMLHEIGVPTRKRTE